MKKIISAACLLLAFWAPALSQPVVNLTATDVLCNGDTNGQIVLEVSNGFPPYTYQVNGGTSTTFPDQPHIYEWVNSYGDVVGDDIGFAIELDSAGNVYVGGSFRGTMIIGVDTLISLGETDAFVAKFGPNGVPFWARSGGGIDFEQTNGITIDTAGNVYATGFFKGTSFFSAGSVTSNGGSFDIFVVKYDANGTLAGLTAFGGIEDDQGRYMSFDDFGNLYLAGEFRSSMAIGANVVTSFGEEDIFILQMDVNLGTGWIRSAGSIDVERVFEMEANGAELAITGSFRDIATFDTTLVASAGGDDIYVAKIDTSGAFVWVETGGGLGDDVGRGLAIDALGRVVISGYTQGGTIGGLPITAVASTFDVLVASYASNSTILWAETYGGFGNDFALGLDVDGQNNVYHTGFYGATAYFGPDSLVEIGGSDIYVAKADPFGTYEWAKTAGSGGFDSGNRLVSSDAGEVYFTGSYTGAGAAFDSFTLNSQGLQDVFVAKMVPGDSVADTLINLAAGQYIFSVMDGSGTTMDTIDIIEPPVIGLSTAVTPATGSTGTNGAIDLTVTGGTPGYTFLWSNTETTEDISGLGTGTYDVTVTDINGCTGTISEFVDTIAPFLALLTVTDVTCQGFDNGSIDLTVSGGTTPYTYLWSNSATTQNLMNVASGTYTVTVTDFTGTTTTGTATVGSNPQNPSPTTDTINGPTVAQPGQSYLYNVVASNGSTYSWNVVGGTLNTSTSNIVSITWGVGPIGTIQLVETNEFGCQANVVLNVTLAFTSVDDPLAVEGLQLYPNPTNGILNMVGSSLNARILPLQIVDVSGRIVWSNSINLPGGAFAETIDVSTLAPGLYFLRTADGSIPAQRLIKE